MATGRLGGHRKVRRPQEGAPGRHSRKAVSSVSQRLSPWCRLKEDAVPSETADEHTVDPGLSSESSFPGTALPSALLM